MPGSSPPQIVWTSAEPSEFQRVLQSAEGTYRLSRGEQFHNLVMVAVFLPVLASLPWSAAVSTWRPGIPVAIIWVIPIFFFAVGGFLAWGEMGRVTTLSRSELSQVTPGRGTPRRVSTSELSRVSILRKNQQAWLGLVRGNRSYSWPIPLMLAELLKGRA